MWGLGGKAAAHDPVGFFWDGRVGGGRREKEGEWTWGLVQGRTSGSRGETQTLNGC